MSKIRLCTVQDRKVLLNILSGSYKPDFKNSYGVEDTVFLTSYRYMLDCLSDKTGESYVFGKDTCIWSWFQNPYFEHHVNLFNLGKDLVVITYEIDSSMVLLSDFDIWCDYIEDGKIDDTLLVDMNSVDKDQCIQAVSWTIPSEGIISVEPFKDYVRKYKNIIAA